MLIFVFFKMEHNEILFESLFFWIIKIQGEKYYEAFDAINIYVCVHILHVPCAHVFSLNG